MSTPTWASAAGPGSRPDRDRCRRYRQELDPVRPFRRAEAGRRRNDQLVVLGEFRKHGRVPLKRLLAVEHQQRPTPTAPLDLEFQTADFQKRIILRLPRIVLLRCGCRIKNGWKQMDMPWVSPNSALSARRRQVVAYAAKVMQRFLDGHHVRVFGIEIEQALLVRGSRTITDRLPHHHGAEPVL